MWCNIGNGTVALFESAPVLVMSIVHVIFCIAENDVILVVSCDSCKGFTGSEWDGSAKEMFFDPTMPIGCLTP
jgi:hypothetical protein